MHLRLFRLGKELDAKLTSCHQWTLRMALEAGADIEGYARKIRSISGIELER